MVETEMPKGGNGNNDEKIVKVEDLGQRPVPEWDEEDLKKVVASADND